DGRHLLLIDDDQRARLWDLKDGRDLTSIAGRWTSGAFLPDGSGLALTGGDGQVLLVDRVTGRRRSATFARPAACAFTRVAVSPDGRRVAAISPQGPIVCVWKSDGGPPTRTLRDHG